MDRGEPIWQTQINAADVDTQFERSRRYKRAGFLRPSTFFRRPGRSLRDKLPVMRGNGVFSQAFGKMMCHAFLLGGGY